jgi:ubiquinone/menaquinone biosynthesis C-methylase UbiE
MSTNQQQYLADIDSTSGGHHTCPFWVGYLLLSPLRKLGENPDTILSPFVAQGMTVADIGCAMGFFSLPLARMVGEKGRVICVDINKKMLRSLEKRARRNRLDRIIETRECTQEDLGLDDLEKTIDLVSAVNVVHEARYPQRFFLQIRKALRPEGKLLLMEPKGHVSDRAFKRTRQLALDFGFSEIESKRLIRSRISILQSPVA